MYYIDTPDAVSASAKPTPPDADSEKFFSDAPGVATAVPAWFLNMLQEELGNVVSGANLSHSKTDNSQLLKAVQALVASKTDGALLASKNLSDVANIATARSNLGLATVASSGSYSDLSNKPALATVATSGSYADLGNKPDLTEYLSRGQIGIAAQVAPGQGGPNGAVVSLNGTALSGFGEVTGYATYSSFDDRPLVWGWSYVIGTGNSPHAGYQGGYRQRVSMGYEHGDYALEWCVPRYGTGPDADPTAVYTRQMTANAWGDWTKISAGNADTLGGYNASQITGAVKKYLVLDQYNGNIIRNSLGISSITDHAVGQYTVSFTTPWPNVYYVPASCTLGDTGNPDCVVIEDEPGLTFWSDTKMRMAHKVSGTGNYVDGRPDTIIFAGM
ncbi:hypothetical protein [Insolitispirillum peregrinum]|uniref:Phage tail fibre repeat-containing protein n=1 Tax=Insolitispirillum peregrinum TaxID=80876 RepID=A0A1N7JK76_9PROT|nr:hypothetical protein [Insolitispirillum peregrinum]SIS49772.1 hypothetical protein SAMN05421779_102350 [Insolitispirillum peregrinum]